MGRDAREMLSQVLSASPLLSALIERWEEVSLPDGWLVAGALAQTYWNLAHHMAPAAGIKDVDIVYFDADDLSERAEADHEARINAAFASLPVRFDVKNEARVHLWYAQRFGYPIRPYASAQHAIATFPTTATSIGVRLSSSGLEVCAPFGLGDLQRLIVRPNKVQITAAIYRAKVDRWRPIWPRLQILEWSDG